MNHINRPPYTHTHTQEFLSTLPEHGYLRFKLGTPQEQSNLMWAIAKGGGRLKLPEEVKLNDLLEVQGR